MPDFVHLHNHTHYSLLDALCLPQELLDAAIADGQKALAITDHGVMFGCYEFYKRAKKSGIKPIIGFEAYIANGSRFEKIAGKSKTKKRNYFHLVLLAKNQTGYKNLMKLTTLAHTEGFYYKPRIDKEILEKYSEGIIAMSACIAGVVNAPLVAGDYFKAYEAAVYYKELFGEDFYIELQRHNLPEDEIILRDAPQIAGELGIKLIATNDVHYLKADQAVAHNVLLMIRDVTAATSGQADIRNLRYRTPEMYFKTKAQMNDLFENFPEALENTLEIADKCNLELESALHMPTFPIPKDSAAQTQDEYLEELTFKGLQVKYGEVTEELKERAKFELNVIKKMEFPGYFLIVQDFMKAAHELGVRVGPGRGSAAGSVVAYALGITNVDPLPYNLLFERFLNPERFSMPDIDIDFCDEKRDKIIDYVKKKYGENTVAQIITFGKLSSRAVLKDVGRVVGIPHTIINEITAKIPVIQGKVTPLAEALELPELREFKETRDEQVQELINFSLLLEGRFRNCSTHAAGIVIAPGDVSDYVPLYQPSKSKGQTLEIATQYTMNELEDAGLLKMDFLGLRTLSIIDHTLEMIKINHDIEIDIDKIDFSDEKTYELISNGDTLAVFQFESQGMQDYLRQLKPHDLEELTAMNALYRPGPMENIPEFIDRKHGRKPISYLHPIMEKSLKNTYGVIVYQEQVMQLARDIAGFTFGQADILRRAMGKKKQSVMDEMQPLFVEGALKNGLEESQAEEIYNLVQKFAKYGFNKSHSLAYSYLAFQTAWLKTHYTAEFLAANMTAELNSLDKIVQLIEEAKKFKIKVLPPDVNRSFAQFTAVDNAILFGLAGIKNVGISAVESIIKARVEKPFSSLFDFAARVDTKLINKRALEALICAGAFDSLKIGHRAALYESIESALDYSKSFQEQANIKMDSLFGGSPSAGLQEPALPDAAEWSEKEMLQKEKDFLNFFISGNPLNDYRPYIPSLSTLRLGDKESSRIGQDVRVCGIIADLRTRLDRHNKPIAFVTLEDFSGAASCVLWSETYANYRDWIRADNVVMFKGKSDLDGDTIKIIVDSVMAIEEAAQKFGKGYYITIDISKTDPAGINELASLCVYPETKNTLKFLLIKGKTRKQFVAYDVQLAIRKEVTEALCRLFGRMNVVIMDV